MKQRKEILRALRGTIGIAAGVLVASSASATAPCGDLGECKALVEINSSDGDIGFHFLMDADDVQKARLKNPDGKRIFKAEGFNQLREQRFTETFVESTEPLCFDPLTDADPENDDEDFATLEDFLNLWDAGTYTFVAGERQESGTGETELTFDLPAAPTGLAFDDATGVISWSAGDDLGECATSAELDTLVMQGDLPVHPQDVPVTSWEIVFALDVDDGDPLAGVDFSIRVPGGIATKEVTVPAEYLNALPEDTPAKIEIGAIGAGDNATFTEVGDICVNENAGCD
ncbi:MAG: hypothetical protein HKN17_02290 [Rhodothermales bacterium]|nr:hypothetical protein [Rhodothermales bacterium]